MSGVQALESSQFMSGAKEMFPHGTAAPQHGAELGKVVRHLPERQELPNLLHSRFPHQPRRRPQPLRTTTGGQSAMQRLCRLRTVPGEVEIVSRQDCGCGLHGASLSRPVAKGKAAPRKTLHTAGGQGACEPLGISCGPRVSPLTQILPFISKGLQNRLFLLWLRFGICSRVDRTFHPQRPRSQLGMIQPPPFRVCLEMTEPLP